MYKPYDPSAGAIDFSGRSPFSFAGTVPGLPPARAPQQDVVIGQDGIARVGGVPLTSYGKPVSQLALTPPPSSGPTPVPQYTPGNYGDAAQFPVNLVPGIPQKVLQRPANTRVSLLIQNTNAVGNVMYSLDKVADTATSVIIPAGGNRIFDSAVPQGDLWLISPAASLVLVEYMNVDLKSAA